jgi:tRNA-specific 2-thiouridylase
MREGDMARIAVLMSGGTDSAGAALLLSRMGHELVGITARIGREPPQSADSDAVYSALRTCHKLGIPHVVLDLSEDFERYVKKPFAQSYMEGKTPNPCALCNREIKFGKVLGMAIRSGFDRVASGHYAAIDEVGERNALCEPADRGKSQVYFLALVHSTALERLEFPLRYLRKREVEAMVAASGLPVRKGESQDLCFVRGGKYTEFLKEASGQTQGQVLDIDGNIVGTHTGHYSYTVGQRFGLRGKRYYVIEKRAKTNEIVIGERDKALRQVILARDVNWFLPPNLIRAQKLLVRYRYNSSPVEAEIAGEDRNRLVFRLSEQRFAPAPGQVLACYKDDKLVCGAIIESASVGDSSVPALNS